MTDRSLCPVCGRVAARRFMAAAGRNGTTLGARRSWVRWCSSDGTIWWWPGGGPVRKQTASNRVAVFALTSDD